MAVVIYIISCLCMFFTQWYDVAIYSFLLCSFIYFRLLGYRIGDPVVILFMGVVFFNARPFLDLIFSISSFGDTKDFFKKGSFEPLYLAGGAAYIKLSILAFMLGCFRFYKYKVVYQIPRGSVTNKYYNIYLILLLVPTCFSSISLLLLCGMRGGYAYFNSGGMDVYLLRSFLPLLTVCLSINLLFYKRPIITWVIIIIGICISLFIGARLLGLMPAICFMVYCSYQYRNAYSKLFPFIGFVIVLFTVFVNYFRAGNSIGDQAGIIFFIKFFLTEISFTSNLVPMAFEYADIRGFAYGINYIGAFASIIPKLAFWMKVSPDTYSFSSALGMFYDPEAILSGLGLNGSLLGESYFSLGYFGLFFVYLYAFLVRGLFDRMWESNILSYIILSSSPYILTSFIFESTIVFRTVVYYSIFPAIIYLAILQSRRGLLR